MINNRIILTLIVFCVVIPAPLAAKSAEDKIVALRQLWQKDPDNAMLLSELAAITEEQGNLDEAQNLYQNLIDLTPDDSITWLRLANLQLKTSQNSNALISLKMAYHLGADVDGIPERISILEEKLGDTREALRWNRRSSTKDPNQIHLNNLHGAQLRNSLGDIAGAADLAKACVEAESPDVRGNAFLLLGQLAYQRGELEVAAGYWLQAHENMPVAPIIYQFLARHFLLQKNCDQALLFYGLAPNSGPYDEQLHLQIIKSLLENNQIRTAEYQIIAYIEENGANEAARAIIRSRKMLK
jgi:tetratricopeptide (TPR) repeat protein